MNMKNFFSFRLYFVILYWWTFKTISRLWSRPRIFRFIHNITEDLNSCYLSRRKSDENEQRNARENAVDGFVKSLLEEGSRTTELCVSTFSLTWRQQRVSSALCCMFFGLAFISCFSSHRRAACFSALAARIFRSFPRTCAVRAPCVTVQLSEKKCASRRLLKA